MTRNPPMLHTNLPTGKYPTGFTLVELMVAMAISLLIVLALVGLFVNSSRSNREMAKASGVIENGRFAIQLLEQDLLHAGYWGGYMPQFDDTSAVTVPGDVPSAVPDPCALNLSDDTYRKNMLGITVQAYGTLPSGAGCLSPRVQRAGTDVLLVRHADTCGLSFNPADALAEDWVPDPGPPVSSCRTNDTDRYAAGRPYIQLSSCTAEKTWPAAQVADANSVTLPADLAVLNPPQTDVPPSATNGTYVNVTVRAALGSGAGQSRRITAYTGATRVAAVAPPWVLIPPFLTLTTNSVPLSSSNPSTRFSLDYALGTASFPLRQRDCAAPAPIHRVVSNLYYVSDFPHPDRPGEVIPTLVRSELDFVGGVLAQQAPVALIEGIEQFRVELGLDSRMTRCAVDNPVDYTAAPDKMDSCNPAMPAGSESLPTNRGDGIPESFVRCTTATPCTAAQLTDVVAAKLYVLVRAREPTLDHRDTKSYCLGEPADNGSCPVASTVAAANDRYKRHVFITSIRLVNVAGRRDTP